MNKIKKDYEQHDVESVRFSKSQRVYFLLNLHYFCSYSY